MSTAVDDELWSAVGEPTRRRMLDLLLADGNGTATSLSEQLPVSRQAVAKHLGVPSPTVQTNVVCIDKHRQWRQAGNVRNSATLRTARHTLTAPVRWITRRG